MVFIKFEDARVAIFFKRNSVRRVPSGKKLGIPLSLRAPYGQLPPSLCKLSGFRSSASRSPWGAGRAFALEAWQPSKGGRTCGLSWTHWIYWIYASRFAYVFKKYAQLGNPMPWISFGSPRICGPGHRLRDIAGPREQRWGWFWAPNHPP